MNVFLDNIEQSGHHQGMKWKQDPSLNMINLPHVIANITFKTLKPNLIWTSWIVPEAPDNIPFFS